MYITKSRLVFIGLVVMVLICLTYAWSQNKNDGDTPYTPSHLEWLAVELNSESLQPVPGASILYVASRSNTLVMIVRSSHMNRALLNQFVNIQKKVILDRAKARGWDTWLKIKEDVSMIKIE